MYEAYPLQWPQGWPRTKERKESSFKMTADKSRKELLNEIDLLSHDPEPVISSNVPLRKRDQQMFAEIANQEMDEPGVAVYFKLNGEQMTLACDKWLTPAENLRALSLTINAMRGLERWGSSQIIKRVFTGFKALPESSEAMNDTWATLGLTSKPGNIEVVNKSYKELCRKFHPDIPGTGDNEKFTRIQQAYTKALEYFKTPITL